MEHRSLLTFLLTVQRKLSGFWFYFIISKVCMRSELLVKETLLYSNEVSKIPLIREVIFAFDCTFVIKGIQKGFVPIIKREKVYS